MNDAILIVNAGSSSIKCSLFAVSATETKNLRLIYHLEMTGIGTHTTFRAKDAQHQLLTQQDLGTADHETAFSELLQWLKQHEASLNLIAAGHRVVHGGVQFTAPVKIDEQILQQLTQLIPLAPLHQPHNLAPIRAFNRLITGLPQVACFDTAFHATKPAVASIFALPRALLAEKGIKRYGFHGLSYEYIAQQLPLVIGELPQRVIVAHLGNGSSMAGLKAGRSIATTMSFTALDGLPMGTRCGAIDPGVLLHLLNEGMNVAKLNDLLYHQAGLLGVSGISNDMAELLQSDSLHAQEAIDLLVYHIRQNIGALAAALEGVDAIVFTGGIGEHATSIRADVCRQMTWLGITLDDNANEHHGPKISHADSAVSVWVIPTDEEKMIAQHTLSIVKA
jgi:acetate kinase